MSLALFDRGAVVDQSADVRAYVSPSRLNLWLKCPLAYRLKYIDGIREPTTPALFLGKAVHASLENFYRHRHVGIAVTGEELARRLLESWGELVDAEHMVFESVAEEQTCQQQAIDLVAAYLRSVPTAEPKPLAVEVSVEAPLVDPATGEDLGIPLLGIMDLVLDEEAGPLIADFKTAARSSDLHEITGDKPVAHDGDPVDESPRLRTGVGQPAVAVPVLDAHHYRVTGMHPFSRQHDVPARSRIVETHTNCALPCLYWHDLTIAAIDGKR